MASQQLMLGVGKGVTPGTYIDQMYKQQLHIGNGSSKTMSTGFSMSGGAAVIVKNLEDSYDFHMSDSIRGATKKLAPNSTAAEDTEVQQVQSFSSSGFTVGNANSTNYNTKRHVSYAFKEEPGFFDIVTYSGNGSSSRNISHGLGCKPGMIWIKMLDGTDGWRVYHHGTGPEYYHTLNTNAARADDVNHWEDTAPTDSVFTVGSNGAVNQNGKNYIAYLWGFGSSPTYAGTFGTNKQLYIASNSNLQMSTGNFTIECFIKPTSFSGNPVIFDTRNGSTSNDGIVAYISTSGVPGVFNTGSGTMCGAGNALSTDTWYHIAVTRSSTTIKLYVDGVLWNGSGTLANNNLADQVLKIGDLWDGDNGQPFYGQISNFRVSKKLRYDQTKFGAPTAPLAFDGETDLLCLNQSLPLLTSKNIFGSLAQAHGDGDVTMSYEETVGYQGGNIFGKDGKQSCIAVGEYWGNGQTGYTNHPEIYLGWEPEWVLVKNATQGDGWHFRDTSRGLNDDGVADPQLRFDSNGGNETGKHAINVMPYGFDANSNNPEYNNNGARYIYFAIRRPDGWVGTPVTNAEKGKFFEAKTGQSDSNAAEPNYSPSLVPDFNLRKLSTSSSQWYTGTRITGQKYMMLGQASGGSSNDAEATTSGSEWSYPTGFGNWGVDLTSYMGWFWRRHAGFDLSLYTGTGSSTDPAIIQHGLGVKPEMVWFKKRNESDPWIVYHSGLGGGISPETYILKLNYDQAKSTGMSGFSYDDRRVTLTSTWDQVNDVNIDHIALMFASVKGVSKCGHYSGSDSTTTVACGFQPRFLLIKNTGATEDWAVFTKSNTTDMASGNDYRWSFSTNDVAQTNVDWGAFTSTGFDLTGNYGMTNDSGDSYIYYAHA
mgnify:CR=1 FL=1